MMLGTTTGGEAVVRKLRGVLGEEVGLEGGGSFPWMVLSGVDRSCRGRGRRKLVPSLVGDTGDLELTEGGGGSDPGRGVLRMVVMMAVLGTGEGLLLRARMVGR